MNENKFGKGAVDMPKDFLQPKAWNHTEIAGAFTPAKWVEKDPLTGFITFPKKNQRQQSSCVWQALAKALSVDELMENGYYRELSPRSGYSYMYVAPDGGSNSLLSAKLAVKQGMTLEILLPTEGKSEADVRKNDDYVTDAKLVAQVYKPQGFIECAVDFETIASIIQGYRDQGLKKVVMITVIGINNGTWYSTFPVPPKNGDGVWAHRIAITDFGLINGEMVLAFDNSWGEEVGNKGQQFLKKNYLPFMYGGIYTINQADVDAVTQGSLNVPPPVYTWTRDLALGSTGDDVMQLQIALQSMGMFPISKVVKPTGAYWGITKNGVTIFQQSFGLPVTGIVDAATRVKLNELF